MPELKEKPTMVMPKNKAPAMLTPKQAAHMLASKYRRQLDQRIPGEENETEYATDTVEDSATGAVDELAGRIRRPDVKRRADTLKERPRPEPSHGEHTPTADEPPVTSNAPKEHTAPQERRPPSRTAPAQQRQAASTPDQRRIIVQKNRAGQAPGPSALNNTRRGVPAALHQPEVIATPQSAPRIPGQRYTPAAPRSARTLRERPRMSAAAIKSRANLPREAKSPGASLAPKLRPRLNQPAAKLTAHRTRQLAQRQLTQRMVTQAQKAAKVTLTLLKRAAVAVAKAAAALIGSLVSIAGGGILLVALVIVIVIAAVANSPFGLFFAAEKNAPDTVSVAEAVAQVNMDYNARLEQLQAGDYDSIVIHGQAPDMVEVLAVFAVKTAGTDVEGMDVATLDAARVAKLKAVFWDMTAITTYVEEIYHPGDGEDDPGWMEYILHITITHSTADDMRTAYSFTPYQNNALDELLADRAALSQLAGNLTITDADVSAVLDALPDDLSPERRAAVETALQLVGKVNYFWGGKSSAIGWDSRWGTLQKVWAEGSSTTGTYRPFGLDCTGYLDWAYRNAGLHSDGHWYIGTNLTEMNWADALPGDIALFPDASHVGMVVGRSESGGILVAHCSSGQNNVVVTDCAATGFTAIGKPNIYG